MTIDLNHVRNVVETIMKDEYLRSSHHWRILDDATHDAQRRGPWPQVEIEFPEGTLDRQESGDRNNNIWSDDGAVMFHVHVERNTGAMSEAKQEMAVLIDLFAGREIGTLTFFDAMPGYTDGGGRGVSRGVSRSIGYRYEFKHR